jgi:hypothetical protein
MGATPLGIVEGDILLEVGSRRGKLSTPEERISHDKVGLQEEGRVWGILGEPQKLLPQLLRRLHLCPYNLKIPESPQYWEELNRLACLLTQLARPAADLLYFWGCPPLGRHQGSPQSDLQHEFLLRVFRGVGQCPEYL